MLKKIVAVIIMLNILLFSMNIVNAADTGSVSLSASSTSVKLGETFTVTVSAKCDDGIDGIDTTYNYDTDKLELVSTNVANNNWVSMGINNAIQIICNTENKITSNDIYILTFKVKENATAGTTAKITTSNIEVESDVSQSNFVEEAKSITVNIISNGSDVSNNNEITEKPDNSESNNVGNQNLGTTNNNSKNTNTNSNLSLNSNTAVTQVLPQTGKANTLLTVFIILAGICSIIFYIRMIKK